MAERLTEWSRDLNPSDWLLDGHAIKLGWMKIWDGLQWHKAVLDFGPSPAGNPGPYFHVPDADNDCSHRLYPKALRKPGLRAMLFGVAITRHCKPARTPAGRSLLKEQGDG